MEAHGGLAFLAKQAFIPASMTATVTGLTVDCLGAEEITFLVESGTFAFDGTNNFTVTVQEGDLSNGTDMATIAAVDYLAARRSDGSVWDRLIDNAADDDSAFLLTVAKSTKRYRRIILTEAGVVTAVMACTVLLSGLRHQQAGATQAP